jgi:predicted methyltransferase
MKIAAAAIALLLLGACDRAGTPAEQPPRVLTAKDIAIPDHVAAAVSDPSRAALNGDDPKRHPAEIVAFSGAKPGDKMLELIPGAGYWTRILSKIAGPAGHVYAVWPQQYARYSVGNVEALTALSKTPDFGNVTVTILPTPVLSAPESLDLVFTSQNYHDYPAEFMGSHDPKVLNDAVFKMLKPGGTYIVIDHAAQPGTTLAQTAELHRIDPALVKQQAAAAGFEFAGELDVLRNPSDRYDLEVFDPLVRGKTDKFALKFRKPAR